MQYYAPTAVCVDILPITHLYEKPLWLALGKLFGCVDIDIKCKNISIWANIEANVACILWLVQI